MQCNWQPKLFFQLFYADEKIWYLCASGIKLIFSTRLDGRKDIKYVQSARLVLHAQLKAHVQPL